MAGCCSTCVGSGHESSVRTRVMPCWRSRSTSVAAVALPAVQQEIVNINSCCKNTARLLCECWRSVITDPESRLDFAQVRRVAVVTLRRSRRRCCCCCRRRAGHAIVVLTHRTRILLHYSTAFLLHYQNNTTTLHDTGAGANEKANRQITTLAADDPMMGESSSFSFVVVLLRVGFNVRAVLFGWRLSTESVMSYAAR